MVKAALAIWLVLAAGCDRVFDLLGDEHIDAGLDAATDAASDACAVVWIAQPLAITESTDPTISADLDEVYFSRNEGTPGYQIFTAKRASTAVGFSAPMAVAAINSTDNDVDPQLLADGLTLLFVSSRGGLGNRLYRTTRSSLSAPWTTPVRVGDFAINVGFAVTPDGSAVLAANDDGATGVLTQYSFTAGMYAQPLPVGPGVRYPTISADGLTLYAHTLTYDLYALERSTLSASFSEAARTVIRGQTSDPFALPDGNTLIVQLRVEDELALLRRSCQ